MKDSIVQLAFVFGGLLIYTLSVFFLYLRERDGLFDDDMSDIIIRYLIVFFPGVNSLFLMIHIIRIIADSQLVCEIDDYIGKKKRIYKYRKERKDKIKLGIIRITPLDPYGEEDWNN